MQVTLKGSKKKVPSFQRALQEIVQYGQKALADLKGAEVLSLQLTQHAQTTDPLNRAVFAYVQNESQVLMKTARIIRQHNDKIDKIVQRQKKLKYIEDRTVAKRTDKLHRKIIEDVRRRPWVTLYGELPCNPLHAFALEMRRTQPYEWEQIKRVWWSMPHAKKQPFVDIFELAKHKKSIATALVSGTSMTARKVFMQQEIHRLLNLSNNMEMSQIVRNALGFFRMLPEEKLKEFENEAERRRQNAKENMKLLIEIRTKQILKVPYENVIVEELIKRGAEMNTCREKIFDA